jgi:hypothetical protein
VSAETRTDTCPICRGEALFHAQTFGDADIVQCPQCGTFKISNAAISILNTITDPERRRRHLQNAKRWVVPDDLPFIRNI